jgi:hypothetical protein
MMKQVALIIATAACTFAAGCSSTTTTRVVQPAPVSATQRTVYPDGTYVDRPVVATTTVPVAPATTTTVYTTR